MFRKNGKIVVIVSRVMIVFLMFIKRAL